MDNSKDIQLSFTKDVFAGAVTLLLFSSFGWPQWVFVAVHVVSVPGAMFRSNGGLFGTFCLIATLVTSIADVVTVLTLTCGIVNCCAPGASSPAFAPTIKVCDPASAGAQGRVISVTAMVSIGVGVFMSAGRAISLEKVVGRTDWIALCLVYTVLRAYQLVWSAYSSLTVPAVEWGITGGLVLYVSFTEWRRMRKNSAHPKKISGLILYAVALSDALLVALPAISSSAVPAEIVPAFYLMQSVTALVATWQAHRLYSSDAADEKDEKEPDEAKGAADTVENATIRIGAAVRARHSRTMCL